MMMHQPGRSFHFGAETALAQAPQAARAFSPWSAPLATMRNLGVMEFSKKKPAQGGHESKELELSSGTSVDHQSHSVTCSCAGAASVLPMARRA